MSQVTDTLTRKLGPLPVWAWGIGAGVGFNVARWAIAKRRPAATEGAPSDGVAPDAAAGTSSPGAAGTGSLTTDDPFAYTPGTVGGYSIPSAYANYGGSQPAGTTPPTATPGGPQTVEEWRQIAYERLMATGQYQPLMVSDALTKWTSGQPITAQEEAVVSAAQRAVGYEVPGGTPAVVRAPAASQVAAPTAPTVPQQTPTPLIRSLVNFGTPGAEGWAAMVLNRTNSMDSGTLVWLRDGDEYQGLVNAGTPIISKMGEPAQAQYLQTVRTSGEAPSTFSPTLRAAWESRRV